MWVTDSFVCHGVQGIFSATLQHINELNFLWGDLSAASQSQLYFYTIKICSYQVRLDPSPFPSLVSLAFAVSHLNYEFINTKSGYILLRKKTQQLITGVLFTYIYTLFIT